MFISWVAVKELRLSYYIGETHNGVSGLGFRATIYVHLLGCC